MIIERTIARERAVEDFKQGRYFPQTGGYRLGQVMQYTEMMKLLQKGAHLEWNDGVVIQHSNHKHVEIDNDET